MRGEVRGNESDSRNLWGRGQAAEQHLLEPAVVGGIELAPGDEVGQEFDLMAGRAEVQIDPSNHRFEGQLGRPAQQVERILACRAERDPHHRRHRRDHERAEAEGQGRRDRRAPTLR
jgi:hypothetical protein